MVEGEVLLDPEMSESFLTELYEKAGLGKEDAAFIASKLVETSLMGVDTHGITLAPIYIKRLRSRVVNPRPQIRAISANDSTAFEVLDGDNGPGIIVAREAMKRAIQLASQFNVGVVGAIRSNHFGAAGLHARMAAAQGMIGVAMSNTTPLIAPYGAKKAIVGNNPLSVAVPTYGDFPLVLDIALSVVAGAKLAMAAAKGERIPLGWAVDSEGRPTDDPGAILKGHLLPVGEHKGYGLALVIDILCGVITGGTFLNQIKGMVEYANDPSETCYLMAAINIPAFMGKEEMKKRMASFCAIVKSTPTMDESTEILLPGEIEHRTFLKRKTGGIPLPAGVYNQLTDLGREMEVMSPLSPIT